MSITTNLIVKPLDLSMPSSFFKYFHIALRIIYIFIPGTSLCPEFWLEIKTLNNESIEHMLISYRRLGWVAHQVESEPLPLTGENLVYASTAKLFFRCGPTSRTATAFQNSAPRTNRYMNTIMSSAHETVKLRSVFLRTV